MRALVSTPDGPRLADVPQPAPKPGQVMVKVAAAPLNRADLAMLKGRPHGAVGGMGAPLGLEWSGEITALGDGVENWRVGDRVMAASGGAFAEYTLGHAATIARVPAQISLADASTMPVAIQTMHDAITTAGAFQPGQSVLILGASSGVGLVGLKVAKFLGARLVIGTSTSPDKRARLAAFGADLALDTNDPAWVQQVLDATDGKGVDLVVDQLAGALLNAAMGATRIGGRIVNVGRMAGDRETFNFDLHALRRITYVGVTFRTRTGRETADVITRAHAALARAIAAGDFIVPIDSRFPLTEADAAFAKMRANTHFGKILLTP